jgi:chromosome condensin MukBEF ATPase and DNA-binding subunit MukB
MTKETPIDAFKRLTTDLETVRKILEPEELAAAKMRLFDDLATGMGLAEFVNPKHIDSMDQVQTKLLQYFDSLDGLAKATFDLAGAQQRITDSFEKQNEYYALFQKAQDALMPAQDKLRNAFDAINDAAKNFGWAAEIVNEMKRIKAEQLGQTIKDAQDSIKFTEQKSDRNAALEKGTLAYFEAQNKANEPILKENQKQTKALGHIVQNTKARAQETISFSIIS